MGLRIQTNVESLRAQDTLRQTHAKLNHTQNKLSSGSRIIRALDDAAGLAISENVRATSRATEQNIQNAENAVILLEVAEGALGEVTDIVIRMRELAIAAASDTNGDRERSFLDGEVQALKAELQRISDTTVYNGRYLLNSELNSNPSNEIVVQVGPENDDKRDRIAVSIAHQITLESMNLQDVDISSTEGAREALDPLTKALTDIATVRGTIGAGESRLETTIKNLQEYNINLKTGFSRIRDADIAKETAEYTKYNILSQAGVAVLAQANNAPALALKLLG